MIYFTKAMTPLQIKQARHALGLTLREMALMMDTDARSQRAYEAPSSASTARTAPPRYCRLMAAYLSGYRPPDWPGACDTNDD